MATSFVLETQLMPKITSIVYPSAWVMTYFDKSFDYKGVGALIQDGESVSAGSSVYPEFIATVKEMQQRFLSGKILKIPEKQSISEIIS